jgi:hypothetical protein
LVDAIARKALAMTQRALTRRTLLSSFDQGLFEEADGGKALAGYEVKVV